MTTVGCILSGSLVMKVKVKQHISLSGDRSRSADTLSSPNCGHFVSGYCTSYDDTPQSMSSINKYIFHFLFIWIDCVHFLLARLESSTEAPPTSPTIAGNVILLLPADGNKSRKPPTREIEIQEKGKKGIDHKSIEIIIAIWNCKLVA